MNERKNNRGLRRGSMLLEVVLAAAALGIVLVMIAQAMVSLDHARRATDGFDLASRELENCLKTFASRPWEELTPESATEWRLPGEVAAQLPGTTLVTTVEPVVDPSAKRITMRLTLPAKPTPLVLTTWVFEPADAEEGEP